MACKPFPTGIVSACDIAKWARDCGQNPLDYISAVDVALCGYSDITLSTVTQAGSVLESTGATIGNTIGKIISWKLIVLIAAIVLGIYFATKLL